MVDAGAADLRSKIVTRRTAIARTAIDIILESVSQPLNLLQVLRSPSLLPVAIPEGT